MAVQDEPKLSPDALEETMRASNISHQNGKHPSNMHTVFLGDCTPYFQWMSMGMFYSHKKSGQPGPITRVMCCTEEQEAALPKVGFCVFLWAAPHFVMLQVLSKFALQDSLVLVNLEVVV